HFLFLKVITFKAIVRCAGSLQIDFRQDEGRKLTLGFKIELGCIFAVVFGGLVYWWVKVH
ncbi:hypothetical protein ACLOBV_10000, partial [Limosilactobacillus fermentum]|uniref:hypothetical protein n=1 Tax=Limosilactobacillus fermentum TaxID=1613 RepID=UPI003EC09F9B